MSFPKRLEWLVIAVLAAVVIIGFGRGAVGAAGAETQDPSSLDRRISMLEQRFYNLESSISRLQQYVTTQRSASSSSSSSSSDLLIREVDQMQQDVKGLQLRLTEVECGLLKLDERTAVGSRKGGDARSADPCRQNPSVPLRLPSRP